MHEEHQTKTRDSKDVPEGAMPAYLLDREGQSRAKVLSNMVKQKRKEKAVRLETLTNTCTVPQLNFIQWCHSVCDLFFTWQSLRTS